MNTIEKLIKQHDKVIERKKLKSCKIYSKELDVDFTATQLERDELLDVAEYMDEDRMRGVNKFIYISLKELQDTNLLNAYNVSRKDCSAIVDILFKQSEKMQILSILEDLNDATINPLAIQKKDIDDLKKK